MQLIPAILTNLITASWIGAIAILAIQNATPIRLKFLTFESIQLPIGLILAFSVVLGLIIGALIKPIWQYGLADPEE